MTIRLTKTIREEIIASVLRSTTLDAERQEIEAATALAAREWAYSKQPARFNEVVGEWPIEWFKMDNGVYVYSYNPLSVIDEALRTSGDRYHSSRVAINFDQPIRCAIDDRSIEEEEAKKVFGKLHKKAEAWAEKRAQAKGELSAFLLSQKTVEAVIEKMPELKRHVPGPTTKSYPLVAASNVLSHLAKLGFDSGATAPA